MEDLITQVQKPDAGGCASSLRPQGFPNDRSQESLRLSKMTLSCNSANSANLNSQGVIHSVTTNAYQLDSSSYSTTALINTVGGASAVSPINSSASAAAHSVCGNALSNNNNNNNNNIIVTSSRRPSASQNGATVLLRKSKSRGIFKSLLCCWGLSIRRRQVPDARNATGSKDLALSRPATDGIGSRVANDTDLSNSDKLLLPSVAPCDAQKCCLIIDLDETLVHSSFKPVKNPDFIIPVEIDGIIHQVYVLKRPFVDEFLQHIGKLYECVLFTASLAKYADPVADLLDRWGVFRARLFREACVFHKGNYVKDLNRLGRELKRLVIVDNSPASYAFHPDNAIPVQSWFDDMNDTELLELIPFMEKLATVENVYTLLRNSNDAALQNERSTPR